MRVGVNSPVRVHGVNAVHRVRVLKALGITQWGLRAQGTRNPVLPAGKSNSACVVVLPAGCSARQQELLTRAFGACGLTLACATRVELGGKEAVDIPHARAYLVLGKVSADLLERHLPPEVKQRADIVGADLPTQILADASAKRQLWQALRRLRRVLPPAGA